MIWLFVSIGFLILGISLIAIGSSGYFESGDNFIGFGVVTLILTGVLGFGLVCSTNVVKYKKEIVTYHQTKTEMSVVIEDIDREILYRFDKKYDFDHITDTTTFYIKFGYNVYNIEAGSEKIVYYDSLNFEHLGKILN